MELRASFREGYTDDVGDVAPQLRGECRLVNCEQLELTCIFT